MAGLALRLDYSERASDGVFFFLYFPSLCSRYTSKTCLSGFDSVLQRELSLFNFNKPGLYNDFQSIFLDAVKINKKFILIFKLLCVSTMLTL